MTNGEKLQSVFPDTKIITQFDNPFGDRFILFTLNNEDMQVNLDWWNAEYKEPTTKNEVKYCDRNICLKNEYNNIGCEDCEVTKSQEPTTNNDLGVETTQMIDKSNFSQEQYKSDLQSAYDCGYAQAKNDLGVDCVSRILVQSAISKSIEYKENSYQLYKRIERLPSVTPQEPKIGDWIPTYGNVKCSVCGSVKDSREVGKATHYCDFCGAKMEVRKYDKKTSDEQYD